MGVGSDIWNIWPLSECLFFSRAVPAMRPGDCVCITKGSLEGKEATVRFVGTTHFHEGEWIGIELSTPAGKNDGSVDNTRYFQCAPKHGLFLRADALKLLPASAGAGGALPCSESDSSGLSPRRFSRTEQCRSPRLRKHASAGPASPRSSAAPDASIPGPEAPRGSSTPRSSTGTVPLDSLSSEQGNVSRIPSIPGFPVPVRDGVEKAPQVRTLAAEKEHLLQRLDEQAGEAGTKEQRVADAEQRVAEVEQQLSEQCQKLQLMEEQCERLEGERHVLSAQVREKSSSAANVIKALNVQVENLQKQVDEKGAQVVANAAKLRDSKREGDAVRTQLQETNAELEERKAELELMQVEKELLEAQNEELEEAVQQLQQKSELQAEAPISDATRIELMSEQQLRAELAEHRKLLVLMNSTLEEKEAALKEYKTAMKELTPLKDKTQKQEAALQDLREQLEAAQMSEQMVEELGDQNLLLTEQVDSLKQEIVTLTEFKELSSELELHHQEELSRREQDILAKEAVLAQQTRMVHIQQKAVQEREAVIQKLREKVEGLQEEVQQLRVQGASSKAELQMQRQGQVEQQQLFSWAKQHTAKFSKMDEKVHEYVRESEGVLFRGWLQAYLPRHVTEGDTRMLQTLMLLHTLQFKADLAVECAQDLVQDRFSVEMGPLEDATGTDRLSLQDPEVSLLDPSGASVILPLQESQVLAGLVRFVAGRLDWLLQAGSAEHLLQCHAVHPLLVCVEKQVDRLTDKQRCDALSVAELCSIAAQTAPHLQELWHATALPYARDAACAACPWEALGPFLALGLAAIQNARLHVLFVRSVLLMHTAAPAAAAAAEEVAPESAETTSPELQTTESHVHSLGALLTWIEGLAQKVRAVQKEVSTLLQQEPVPVLDGAAAGLPDQSFYGLLHSFGTILQWTQSLNQCLGCVQAQASERALQPSAPLYSPEVAQALKRAFDGRIPGFVLPPPHMTPGVDALGPAVYCYTATFEGACHSPPSPGPALPIAEHLQNAFKPLLSALNILHKLGSETFAVAQGTGSGDHSSGTARADQRLTARERRAQEVRAELGSVDGLRQEIADLQGRVQGLKEGLKEAEVQYLEADMRAKKLEAAVDSTRAKDEEIRQLQVELETQRQHAAETLRRTEFTHAEAIGNLESDVQALQEDKAALQARLQDPLTPSSLSRPLSNLQRSFRALSPQLADNFPKVQDGAQAVEGAADAQRQILQLQDALKFAKARALVPANTDRKLLLLAGHAAPKWAQAETRALTTTANGYLNELHSLGKAAERARRTRVVEIGTASRERPPQWVWGRERQELWALQFRSHQLQDNIAALACRLRHPV